MPHDEVRTQADRTNATRTALELVTIDLLVERGWAAVSAIEVCTRAGLSRGAFHHHYTSLAALYAGALRRLYEEIAPEISADAGPPPDATLLELVDRTWSALRNPRFKAVLEAWLAMSNDPSLRDEIGPVVADFAELVGPDQLAEDGQEAVYLMARETLLGLALGRAVSGGHPLPHEATVVEQLRRTVSAGSQTKRKKRS